MRLCVNMSSGFVTETEVAEARKKRQEEWEKVRQPDQPIERPEEPYDARSLFERLKEQRDKKDLEFEESHKLKNLIRGLDDDEINFLEIVDKAKLDAEKRQQLQEDCDLFEFRQRVATLQEKTVEQRKETMISKAKLTKVPVKPSQKSLLAGVVRKRVAADDTKVNNEQKNEAPTSAKVSKTDDNTTTTNATKQTESKGNASEHGNSSNCIDLSIHNKGAMKCIGILPGIGKYKDSSDSEKSTDTDDDYDFSDFDWVGRKVKKGSDDGCHD